MTQIMTYTTGETFDVTSVKNNIVLIFNAKDQLKAKAQLEQHEDKLGMQVREPTDRKASLIAMCLRTDGRRIQN